jgi:hypothetical protein
MTNQKADKVSYFGWFPILEPTGDAVSIFLTAGACAKAPITGRLLAADILRNAELRDDHIMFGCDEFVTSYFSGSRWEECWDLRVLLSTKISKRYLPELVKFPFESFPDATGQVRARVWLRVIADFESRKTLEACRKEVQKRAEAQIIKWPDQYAMRHVGARHYQLCIDIGAVERTAIAEVLPAANAIIEICQEMGGGTQARATSGK